MSDGIRPFSCGTQYIDWENANCCQCKKYSDDASACDLQLALSVACVGDGTIDWETAERIGYEQGQYCWACSEIELTEEWIEWVREKMNARLPMMEGDTNAVL